MAGKKTIFVTGCENCVFRHAEYDDFAVGSDSTETCVLAYNLRKPEYFIDMYDSKKGEGAKLETPEWCPLKEGNVLVKFKK